MTFLKRARRIVRRMALGNTDLPQQCTVAMPDPQEEITVWLHAAGPPCDVTEAHAPACALPFAVGIGLKEPPGARERVSLRFCERYGQRRMLGEIGLRQAGIVATNGPALNLFQARSCRNRCLPWPRLWAHQLFQAYSQSRGGGDPDLRMDALAMRSMIVLFICPRPVVLVSVMNGDSGNIFPMNLLGSIGNGYMAFALNSSRRAAPLVEKAGRAVFSNIPWEYSEVARQLRGNHRRDSVEWDQLPFEIRPSASFGVPIPSVALRVREMEIEAVRKLGSHTLFVARVIHDELCAARPQFAMIHGMYQARRLRTGFCPADPPPSP
jgi:flavin reductase (DIM6/NTAB) family NADH-FMN oxidoreductase RutF